MMSSSERKKKIISYKPMRFLDLLRSTLRLKHGTSEAITFISPALLIILGIVLYSVGYNLYMSFFRVGIGGISSRRWVGIDNFIDLLNSKVFWEVAGNTLFWVVGITVVLEVIALVGAILLNQAIKGRGIYRTILLLPWVIPGVVTGILWKYMFDAQFGVINDILMRFGLIDHYTPWLSQPKTAMIAIMVAYIWKVFPLAMIIILGALQGISGEVLEMAEIEGADTLQKFRYVTLPLLRDVIGTTTVFSMITAFNSFDLTYIMTGGGPVNSSEILGMYIYNLGFKKFDFGSASATATVMFVISFGLILFYVHRKRNEEVI